MRFRDAVFALAQCLCPMLLAHEAPVPVRTEAGDHAGPGAPGSATEKIAFMEADGQGRAWAALAAQGPKLARLEKGAWRIIELKDFPSALRALGFVRLLDGSIACLWRDEATDDKHFLSRHSGDKHVIHGGFARKLNQPRLLALDDGGLAITHRGAEALRWDRKLSKVTTGVIPDDAFTQPKKQEGSSPERNYADIRAVQHAGALWLWSPAMTVQEHLWRIRGVFRWGAEDISLPDLSRAGIQDAPISVVTPWADGELAIAGSGVRMTSWNFAKGTEMVFQDVNEWNFVERVFESHGLWHFITTPRPDEVKVEMSKTLSNQLMLFRKRFYDPEKRSTALSSVNGERLTLLSLKLESEPWFGWWDRPVLTTGGGFWAGTREGATFFPKPGQKGRPLPRPSRRVMQMLPAGPDKVIFLDDNGTTFLVPATPAARPDEPEPRARLLKTKSLLVEDRKGRIWGRLADGKFHRWESGGWKELETPQGVLEMGDNIFVPDGRDQAWLVPWDKAPAAVCHLDTGHWETFESLEAALVKRLAPATQLRLRDFPGLVPFSNNESPPQIAFLRQDGTVSLFRGSEWHRWHVHDFAGADAKATGAPSFDSTGRLTLGINHQDWLLAKNDRWQDLGRSDGGRPSLYRSNESKPPPDCPVKNVSSTAYDRHGTCWLMDNERRLWKCAHGRAVPVLQPGEANPLQNNGGSLYEVHADDKGNAFLRTKFGWGGEEYLAIRARVPAPRSSIEIGKIVADTVPVRFGEGAWHVWRLDGGSWSKAEDVREHTFTDLTPGEHEIEVLALNADLTPASATATRKVAIRAAGVREIESWIAQLGGDDLDASETVARRLAAQGRTALPLLRERRATASDSASWWIDAIIQRIEKGSPRPQ